MQTILRAGLLTLLLGFTTLIYAQRPGGPGQLRELLEQLDLTETQQEQLRALHAAQRTEAKALREREFADPAERRAAQRALRQTGKTALEAILTEDQRIELRALLAARRAERPRPDRKALREDVRAYRQDHIQPVMRAQRAKLEPLLSAADRALIDELRPKAKAARRTLSEQLKALKAERRPGEPVDRARVRAQREALEAEYATELAQLQALVERYTADIDRLLAEVDSEQLRWKDELHELVEEHRGERRPRRPHAERGAEHPRKDKRPRMENLKKAQFLLLHPDAPEAATGETLTLRVSPNPATDRVHLRYTLPASGNTRIELKDAAGQSLRTVLDQVQRAGGQRATLDVSDLPPGTYYLSVVQEAQQQTVSFVVAAR